MDQQAQRPWRLLPALAAALALILLGLVHVGSWPAQAGEGPGASAAPEPSGARTWLGHMHWIDGAWTGRMGGTVWEVAYTSGRGGERFSINKVMRQDRVVSYEVERFRVHDDKLIMTPFPGGKEAATFTLDPARSSPTRLVFLSPENEFPKQIVYEQMKAARVEIALSGSLEAKAPGPRLVLERAPSGTSPAPDASDDGDRTPR